MDDFLKFKKMLTPMIIQVVFWIGLVATVLMALFTMFKVSFFQGLIFLVLGPALVRIYCELMIVIFSINDTLTEIRNKMKD